MTRIKAQCLRQGCHGTLAYHMPTHVKSLSRHKISGCSYGPVDWLSLHRTGGSAAQEYSIVSAEKYASLARGHWEIENGLHWILDIHFREDSSTANADHAMENLALLRKIAFNFTKLDPTMQKKTIKKKMIDYMTDLELFKRLIYEIVPTVP